MKSARTPKGLAQAKPSPADLAVQESEQRYLGLLEMSRAAIVIVCESRIVFASTAAAELLGVEAADNLLEQSFLDFIRPKDRDAVAERISGFTLPAQTAPFVRRKLRKADGKTADVEVALHACVYGGKLAVQVLLRDVTERRRLQAQVTRLAHYDALTELANRGQHRDRLEGAMARAVRNKQLLGVLCLGLDHFRAINDSLGQEGGDLVLMQVAERLKKIVRQSDTIARLGGDEFSVILEGLVDKDGAEIAAQRELAALSEPYLLDGNEVRLTVSIGIAIFPIDTQDRDALLGSAILAMHHAKQNGRNRCQFYSTEMAVQDRSGALRRAEIESRLRNLTPRESEVLDLLIAGKASKMIAYLLGISVRTIDIHRARVMDKMQAGSLAELVLMKRELNA